MVGERERLSRYGTALEESVHAHRMTCALIAARKERRPLSTFFWVAGVPVNRVTKNWSNEGQKKRAEELTPENSEKGCHAEEVFLWCAA